MELYKGSSEYILEDGDDDENDDNDDDAADWSEKRKIKWIWNIFHVVRFHSSIEERCLLSQVTRVHAHATLSRETRESSDGDDLSDLWAGWRKIHLWGIDWLDGGPIGVQSVLIEFWLMVFVLLHLHAHGAMARTFQNLQTFHPPQVCVLATACYSLCWRLSQFQQCQY